LIQFFVTLKTPKIKMTSPQIQAIRERYKTSLPEKAELIAEQVDALSQSNASAFDETHSALHKLAGSSGMYGYDDIAVICRSAMVSAQQKDTQLLIQQLSELIAMLEKHAKS
jgi:HPt (histidine-containing phosphotransfer) domain-containing protein